MSYGSFFLYQISGLSLMKAALPSSWRDLEVFLKRKLKKGSAYCVELGSNQ